MSDVEKYGLFALVFVVGVLGLAWLLDPAEGVAGAGDGPVALRTVPVQRPSTLPRPAGSSSGRSAVLPAPLGATERATTRKAPQAKRDVSPVGVRREGGASTFRVKSLTEGRGAFDPSEPPIVYPGEHSSSTPRVQGARIEHTIVKNETLGDISMRYFGTSTKWKLIQELNPGLDPQRLQLGQRIIVHDGSSGTPQLAQQHKPSRGHTGRDTYIVRKGDSLSLIAQKMRGSVRFTDEIFQANRDQLRSPDDISEGMVLVIP